MNIVKMCKCFLCIIKCNKYLYYIRKMLCTCAAVVAITMVIICCGGNMKSMKCCMKKMKEKIM